MEHKNRLFRPITSSHFPREVKNNNKNIFMSKFYFDDHLNWTFFVSEPNIKRCPLNPKNVLNRKSEKFRLFSSLPNSTIPRSGRRSSDPRRMAKKQPRKSNQQQQVDLFVDPHLFLGLVCALLLTS